MESYSVKAVLSAVDKGFTNTIKSSIGSLNGIKGAASSATSSIMKIASGIGVFKAVSAGADLLKSSVSSAFARQDTMEQFNRTITAITGNADAAGNALNDLKGVTKGTAYGLDVAAKATQDFVTRGMEIGSATRSVGAWADAVAFYGRGTSQQLSEVTDAIAKMRTKGTVEMDQLNRLFDVGIDAVGMYAKAVGRDSASVQDDLSNGKISAEDFLNTVESAMMEGTNGVQKIAGAAKEAGASWTGTFDNMRAAVTRGTLGIINSIDDMLKKNGFPTMRESIKAFGDTAESVLGKVSEFISNLNIGAIVDKIKPYWQILKDSAIEVKNAFGDAISEIIGEFKNLTGAFGTTESISSFSGIMDTVTGALKTFAGFLKDHAETIAKVIQQLPKIIAAYQGFKILRTIAPLVGAFTGAIGGLAKLGLSKLAPKLFGVAKGQDAVGKSSGGSSKKMLASAKSFMMVGAGVAIIAGGFYLLASAAIKLSNSGGMAIGIMAVMTGAVLALSFGMMSLLKNVKTTPARLNAVSNAFLKMSAGIALVVGSLAVLALALVPLASLGTTAVPPLLAFGIVVGGLAAILGAVGKRLQASAVGIAVFAAAVSVMALAMTPIAQTGLEGAAAMGAFGLVVAGLVAVFGLFGSALNVAIPGMIAFGLTIVAVGAGMALAEGFIRALPPVIQQLGDSFSQVAASIADAVSQIVSVVGDTLCNVMTTAGDVISQVVDSINEGFETIADGISSVIDSISGGFSSVLDSIAGVIESVGNSARNAGAGFQAVAVGITMIAELSLLDIAKSLGAVALGLGEISTAGAGLPDVANGMLIIVTSLIAATTGMMAFYESALMVVAVATTLKMAVDNIKAAFEGFVITPPDMSSVTAAFMQVVSSARETIPALAQAGAQAGIRFNTGLLNGCNKAQIAVENAAVFIADAAQTIIPKLSSAAKNAMDSFNRGLSAGFNEAETIARSGAQTIVSALDGVPDQMYRCGYFIGIGLANGMRSALGEVQAIATQLAAAAEEAVIAKSKIGSPSKVFIKLGEYIGEGFAIGIESMGNLVERVSENMVSIPSALSFAGVPSGSISRSNLNSEYSYNPVVYVSAELRNIMDGKEVGRVSAPYVKAENDRSTKVKQKINGIR